MGRLGGGRRRHGDGRGATDVATPIPVRKRWCTVRTPGDIGQSVDGGDSYAQRRAETYAALATSTTVSTRVIADTGWTCRRRDSPDALRPTTSGAQRAAADPGRRRLT